MSDSPKVHLQRGLPVFLRRTLVGMQVKAVGRRPSLRYEVGLCPSNPIPRCSDAYAYLGLAHTDPQKIPGSWPVMLGNCGARDHAIHARLNVNSISIF